MSSVINYITQDEIEAHEAAMQRVVENEKREQEAIDDKKRRAIEAAQKAFNEAVKAAENESAQELKKAKDGKEEKLAVMQRDFKRLSLLRQVYHEAPDDVFELIISKCCRLNVHGWGFGGLTAFRLADQRFKQVVESCTTQIVNQQVDDGPGSFPVTIIQRCRRIERIVCLSHNLRSLEGCPNGLKKLRIGHAPHLSDLSPLASCSMMEYLQIDDSSITDISAVASMPLLEVFICQKAMEAHRPSIKDLSPLASCPRLKELWIYDNSELEDISPISDCKALQDLDISGCPLVTSLAPISNLKNLQRLECAVCPLITSLSPLSNLKNLKELLCYGIEPQTSLLPLASCTGLEKLECDAEAVDLEELRNRMPQLNINEEEYYDGEDDDG